MSFHKLDSEGKNLIPFTESGKYFDEVRLIFDDKQELFVSQNFLIMVSPVFEAMFKSNFKEKQTMTVNMKEKNYADFLEFLLCIHPESLKPIKDSNVLCIVPIAEEYQVSFFIQRCQSYMRSWLDKELVAARGRTTSPDHLYTAKKCLRILTTANSLNFEDLTEYASTQIAKFGFRFYYGSFENSRGYSSQNGVNVPVKDAVEECRELFINLPTDLRFKILSQRLALCDNDEIK